MTCRICQKKTLGITFCGWCGAKLTAQQRKELSEMNPEQIRSTIKLIKGVQLSQEIVAEIIQEEKEDKIAQALNVVKGRGGKAKE